MRYAVRLEAGLEPFPGYHLRRLLGFGSFAEVWEAEAADGGRVALKFLPAERQNATPGELRSLQAVRQLLHPNLIRIGRVWCHLGYIVIAMELADGRADRSRVPMMWAWIAWRSSNGRRPVRSSQ